MVHPDRAATRITWQATRGRPDMGPNARNILAGWTTTSRRTSTMSTSFYWNHRPSIRNCGEVAGARRSSMAKPSRRRTTPTTATDSTSASPRITPTSSSTGSSQQPAEPHDGCLGPLVHGREPFRPVAAGRSCCGAPIRAASCDRTAGPPMMNFAGNIPYNASGRSWQRFGYEKNDRWQFSNDLTWVKGRHTTKVGVEYRHHTFPSRGWATSTGGGRSTSIASARAATSQRQQSPQTGDPFASFLLGQVTVQSDHPGLSDVRRGLHGGVDQRRIQGEGQADGDPRAALRLSVRPHRKGRSVLDLRSEHAQPGGGNIPGALIFAGTGPGRTGSRKFAESRTRTPGARGSGLPTDWETRTPSAAATECITRE